jgi:hypothetical protein
MAVSLEKLLFKQGGKCFFCKQPLIKFNASIEHLVAKSKGGADTEDNCVACCPHINQLLGNASIKEKMQIVINHNGDMQCPADLGIINIAVKDTAIEPVLSKEETVRRQQQQRQQQEELKKYNRVNSAIGVLKRCGKNKPTTMQALLNFIKTRFKEKNAVAVVQDLLKLNVINIHADGKRMIYGSLKPRHPPESEIRQEVEIAKLPPTAIPSEDFGLPPLPELSEGKKAQIKQDADLLRAFIL